MVRRHLLGRLVRAEAIARADHPSIARAYAASRNRLSACRFSVSGKRGRRDGASAAPSTSPPQQEFAARSLAEPYVSRCSASARRPRRPSLPACNIPATRLTRPLRSGPVSSLPDADFEALAPQRGRPGCGACFWRNGREIWASYGVSVFPQLSAMQGARVAFEEPSSQSKPGLVNSPPIAATRPSYGAAADVDCGVAVAPQLLADSVLLPVRASGERFDRGCRNSGRGEARHESWGALPWWRPWPVTRS